MPRYSADVAVIGNGPAGIAAALVLATEGVEVLVVARAGRSGRVPETLPPDVRVALEAIGAEEVLESRSCRLLHGNRSRWGTTSAVERHFLLSPYGQGWHVDRDRFDSDFTALAERRGMRSLNIGRRLSVARVPRGWRIETDANCEPIEARFVIDASGRAGAFAWRHGSIIRWRDASVALTAVIAGVRGANDGYTIVESVPDGWVYGAPIDRDRFAVIAVLDRDSILPGSGGRERTFMRHVNSTVELSALLGSASVPDAIRAVAASPQFRDPTGDGWLAVGDAALAYDPLSSSGVTRALEGGRRGATATLQWLRGDESGLDLYRNGLLDDFRRHMQLRGAYYAMERRYADQEFWARRSARSEQLALAGEA
jgi:flavin-dependent dehydrogenase